MSYQIRIPFVAAPDRLMVFAKEVAELPAIGSAVGIPDERLPRLRIEEHGTTEDDVGFGITLFGSPELVERLGGAEHLVEIMENMGFQLVVDRRVRPEYPPN